MRRPVPSAALLGLLTPFVLVAPLASSGVAAPASSAAPATRSATSPSPVRRPVLADHVVAPRFASALATTTAQATARFSTFGASWTGTLARGAQVQVRTRATDGTWSPWTPLETPDGGPDAGSHEALTAASRTGATTVTEPVWSGPADGVQTRVVGGEAPAGLRLALVDAGTSSADAVTSADALTGASTGALTSAAASAGPAAAASDTASTSGPAQPTIYTRAQWGADESLRSYNKGCTKPDYAATVKMGFVHHTDNANDYSANDVPALIRGIYAYHVKTEGWCDVGYNFLIDRFGRIWEGRYGGTTRPVIGAHTGGFNNGTFAASLIGNYQSTVPSAATLTSLEQLFAWKLALTHVDPTGTTTLKSAGGGTAKYAAGVSHTFSNISGHRDAGNTDCPGTQMYVRLGAMRSAVIADTGPDLTSPAASARTRPYAGSAVSVTFGLLEQQDWELDLVKAGDGTVVKAFTGSGTGRVTQSVPLTDPTGTPLPATGYTFHLSSTATGDTSQVAVPWSAPFDITPTASSPATTTTPAVSTYVPVTPYRVLDTRSGVGGDTGTGALQPAGRSVVQVTGAGGVPSSGVAAVAVNITAVDTKGPDFLTVYPADSPLPGTSSVNVANKQTHATLVVPRVGTDGHVAVYNGAGVSDAVLDVVGYYPTSTTDALGQVTQGGATYHPVTPARIVDTRKAGAHLADKQTRSITVAGLAGVPSDATAVVANVTVTGATSDGLLTVYPASGSRPLASSLNFVAKQVTSNRVVSGLSNGALSVYSQVTRGDLVVDVVGWYGGSTGSSFSPLTPARILDTRTGNGAAKRKVASASTTVLQVAGRSGVPSDATAVVMTLTATDTTADGYVTAWPGGARPLASDVNSLRGGSVANLVVVGLTGGRLSLYNAGSSASLVGDVLGYYQ